MSDSPKGVAAGPLAVAAGVAATQTGPRGRGLKAFTWVGKKLRVISDDDIPIDSPDLTGPPGDPGARGNIVTGLTLGSDSTLGNLGIQVGAVVVDVHPAMKRETANAPLVWIGLDGNIYEPGAVPGFANLTPGQAIALVGKTTPGGRNWVTYDQDAAVPAAALPNAVRISALVGQVRLPSLISFNRQPVFADVDAFVQVRPFDNMSSYTGGSGSVDPTTKFSRPWAATASALKTYVDAAAPSGRELTVDAGTALPAGQIALATASDIAPQTDGVANFLVQKNGAQEEIILGARFSGAVGTETGVALVLNTFTKKIYTVQWSNGIRLQTSTAQVSYAALANDAYFWGQLEFFDTRVRGRVWTLASGVAGKPVWTSASQAVTGYGSVVGAGLVGVGVHTGAVRVGALSIGTGFGEPAFA